MDFYEMGEVAQPRTEAIKAGLAALEKRFAEIERRLQAVERATLPQPYNPDEAEGGTAGGPQ